MSHFVALSLCARTHTHTPTPVPVILAGSYSIVSLQWLYDAWLHLADPTRGYLQDSEMIVEGHLVSAVHCHNNSILRYYFLLNTHCFQISRVSKPRKCNNLKIKDIRSNQFCSRLMDATETSIANTVSTQHEDIRRTQCCPRGEAHQVFPATWPDKPEHDKKLWFSTEFQCFGTCPK